jgi:predicted glycoside hydrolase/deacetylase ChbG (UPF0249 family)/folate-dependent phosphoribosylglycinamide formyltransferase PurN
LNLEKKLILHADDLGLTLGFNDGILEAAMLGNLTSTCIRTNGAAYDDAIKRILPKIPQIAVGLHLNIVEGKSTRTSIGSNELLCDPDGTYKQGFGGLLRHRRNEKFIGEIELDFRDQIERAVKDLGEIDHLNSHQHSHGIPEIFEIVCKLAVEYNIPYVRCMNENLYFSTETWKHFRPWYALNTIKWLILSFFSIKNRKTAAKLKVNLPDRFVGVLYTGHMSTETVIKGLDKSKRTNEVVEVLLHPSKSNRSQEECFLDSQVRDYGFCTSRQYELDAIKSTQLDRYIDNSPWELTNYKLLASKQKWSRNQELGKFENQKTPPYKTHVFLDETPFYHPKFFLRLLQECPDIQVTGVSIVELPHGGKLQSYMLKNWFELGLPQLVKLGFKSILLRLLGALPRSIKGDHFGSVKAVAKAMSIPFEVIQKVNTPEFLKKMTEREPDLIISSNALIFGPELIGIPKIACINRHSALLPRCGGILPVFRAVQFEHKFTGASVHKMVEKIDAGEVLSRKWVPIYPGDTLSHLYSLCFLASFEAVKDAIKALSTNGKIEDKDLENLPASYFSYPTRKDWQAFRSKNVRFI